MRTPRQKASNKLAALRIPRDNSRSLEEAKKIAQDSSTKNRNFYIAYLALSFYVLVIALGITDKELFLDQRQLAIALLSLGLKPSIWFWVAPGALFTMYLDLILNLREHLSAALRELRLGALPTRGRVRQVVCQPGHA
jgi:hypothetical protein